MDLQRPKCDFNDFPEAPDWAVCVIDNGVHSAFCEEFHYMARAQWLGGREFRVSNPTAFTVIASRNESGKPEWDGEGLPPVGSEVQCICNQFPSEGQEKLLGKILYSGEYTILHTYQTNGQHHVPVESVLMTKHWSITPIRSEADKKRDEAAKGLIEYLDKETDIDNVFSIKDVIGFYDAIAAGKIPHIRID